MSGGSRVYVGRLSYQTREKDIERFFRGFGRLTEVNLKNGFGFVEFEDSRDADDAVYELNGRELFGERLIVEHARGPGRRRDRGDDRYGGGGGYRDGPRRGGFDRYGSRGGQRQSRDGDKYGPPVRTEYRLIVENLSSKVSWQDLKDYVRQAGEVTFADAHKQRKNEGIVEFSSRYDMENVIKKLDNTELNGRKIRLVEDRPSRKRSRSRSRSRSHRSRSRSRSRSHSRSRSRSRSRSKSKSPKRSRSKSRSKSRSRSKSKSKSRSRSPPPKKSRSRSPSPKRDDEKKSPEKSPARSKSRSRSKSQSPSKDD